MDETVTDFFVSLPSNSSAEYYPQNTQASYRTKLISPLVLNGSWEVGLSEIFIPRNWFNIGEHNNDYVISSITEKSIPVEFSRYTFSFNYGVLVSLNADISKEDFFSKLNENISQTLNIENAVQFVPEQRGDIVHVEISEGFEVHLSKKHSFKMLHMFGLPTEDHVFKESKQFRFTPLPENKEQLFSVINRNPKHIQKHLIPIAPIQNIRNKDIDVFSSISKNISDLKLGNYITFIYDKETHQLEIGLLENTELHIDKDRAASFLSILNESNNLVITKKQKFNIILPISVQDGESMELYVKKYPMMKWGEKETKHLNLNVGMYHSAESLFREFHHIHLGQLPSAKVSLQVPPDSEVTFGRGLADMLGFVNTHFKEGEYISDYSLELDAGITEIFVYSDLVESHHVGDTYAPVLRIIPCMNEKNAQIVKHYEKPLYFPLRSNFVNTIDIELKTSSGKSITFMGGKTFILLSFRRRKTIN